MQLRVAEREARSGRGELERQSKELRQAVVRAAEVVVSCPLECS